MVWNEKTQSFFFFFRKSNSFMEFWRQPWLFLRILIKTGLTVSEKVFNSLTLSQTSPGFYVSVVKNLSKTQWEECFLPFRRTFYHFHQIRNSRLRTLSVWKSLKFGVCEKVNKQQNFSLVQTESICRQN